MESASIALAMATRVASTMPTESISCEVAAPVRIVTEAASIA